MQVHSRECKVQKPQIEAPFVVEHESITWSPSPFRPPFWHREVSAGTQEKWPFLTVYAVFSPALGKFWTQKGAL